MKRAIILLTYNEIEALPKIFDRIPLSCADEMVAIDGGSKDGTREYLAEKGLRVVVQDYVRPPGARFAMNMFFYTLGFILFVLGTVVVFTFDPSRWLGAV